MPASFPRTVSSITPPIEITNACKIQKQSMPVIKTQPTLTRANTAPNLDTNNDASKQLLFDKIKPELIAEQLTVLMYDIFMNISFNNNNNYTDNNINNSSIKNYIQIFNQTVKWVQYSILSAQNSKYRAKIICKWIKICEILLKKNNFHGLIAVQCALRSNSVYYNKLKIAWTKHKSVFRKKYHNKLQMFTDIVSYEDNYKLLRNKMHESTNIDCECVPVLPYWGLFKRDCLLINEFKNTQNAMNLLIKQYNEYRQCIGIYTKIKHDKLIQSWICYQLNQTDAITIQDMEIMSDNVRDFDKNIYGKKKRYSLKRK